jgi:tagatose-1,6-bisphosphate aldolase
MSQSITSQTSLHDIATPEGTFAVLAMDQRNTLKRMFAAAGVNDPSDDDLVDYKADLLESLNGSASGFLLDPTFGTPALSRLDDPRFGVLVAAEPSSRGNFNGEPRASRDPDLNAAWVHSLGGHAVKFLIQLRADRKAAPGEPDLAAEALEVSAAVIADCRESGAPSVIENLIYPLPGEEPLSPAQRSAAIIEAAVALDALEPDLLKLEYPGSPEACRKLADSIKSPWAVLSAGVGFEEFADVLKVSCDEGGASGFIAGRSVWKDTVGMDSAQRRTFLELEGRRRLDGLVSAMDGRARPWTEVRPS